jgi:transcriptional regulator with XRE-family HTH domain
MGDEQATLPPSSSFGEEMRKEREIRSISLKEIADATKISKRYLEAIEKDDYKVLPAAVFTRGFVREYARYLGLNPDEAVNRYLHYRQGLEETGAVPKDTRREPGRDIAHEPLREMRKETARETLRKIQTAQDAPAEPPRRRVSPAIIVFVLIVALFAVAVWLVQNPSIYRRTRPRPAPQTTTEPIAPTVAPPPATPAPVPDSDLILRIRARENSWVTLDADGRSVFNSELRRGEEQTFRARDRFVFRTVGNAGGIDLTLNGVPVPPMGESGEVVRNRSFDREFAGAQGGPPLTQAPNTVVTQEP